MTKGEELYFIYQPINAADGNWFGYINQVTYTALDAEPDEPEVPVEPEQPTEPIEPIEPTPPPSVEIVMVGDMLMHGRVMESGLKEDGSYNFDHLFENVKDSIENADLALVNQETILGVYNCIE